MTLGGKIKAVRQEAGDSQENLANQIGISRQTVISWEKGRTIPDSESLIRIAILFNKSVDEWMGLGVLSKSKDKSHVLRYLSILLLVVLACLVATSNLMIFMIGILSLLSIFIFKEFMSSK